MSTSTLDSDMEPPTKRAKTEELQKPIIFTTPGAVPDVYMKVFSKEFHVQSFTLKANSAFFRKFLDPSNAEYIAPGAPLQFRYEWFTKVEPDGDWVLSSDKMHRHTDTTTFGKDVRLQERAFNKLLCAIFHRAYTITSFEELCTMAELGGYYCALPVLSESLNAAMLRSAGYLNGALKETPCSWLELATKLRNPILFKESMIHVLGPWSEPRHEELLDLRLKKIARNAFSGMKGELYQIFEELLQLASSDEEEHMKTAFDMLKLAAGCRCSLRDIIRDEFPMPYYLRRCLNGDYVSDWTTMHVRELLHPLLKSNLVLDNTGAGVDHYFDSFLCFEILDEDLPWDLTQTEW